MSCEAAAVAEALAAAARQDNDADNDSQCQQAAASSSAASNNVQQRKSPAKASNNNNKKLKKIKKGSGVEKQKKKGKGGVIPVVDPLLEPFGDAAEDELRKKLKKKLKELKRIKKQQKEEQREQKKLQKRKKRSDPDAPPDETGKNIGMQSMPNHSNGTHGESAGSDIPSKGRADSFQHSVPLLEPFGDAAEDELRKKLKKKLKELKRIKKQKKEEQREPKKLQKRKKRSEPDAPPDDPSPPKSAATVVVNQPSQQPPVVISSDVYYNKRKQAEEHVDRRNRYRADDYYKDQRYHYEHVKPDRVFDDRFYPYKEVYYDEDPEQRHVVQSSVNVVKPYNRGKGADAAEKWEHDHYDRSDPANAYHDRARHANSSKREPPPLPPDYYRGQKPGQRKGLGSYEAREWRDPVAYDHHRPLPPPDRYEEERFAMRRQMYAPYDEEYKRWHNDHRDQYGSYSHRINDNRRHGEDGSTEPSTSDGRGRAPRTYIDRAMDRINPDADIRTGRSKGTASQRHTGGHNTFDKNSRGAGRRPGHGGVYQFPSRRSVSPVDPNAFRPKPEQMPQHIKWLHDRWQKYDREFFQTSETSKPKKVEWDAMRNDMDEWRKELDDRRKGGRNKKDDDDIREQGPYINGRMMAFKEFLLGMPDDVTDQDRATQLYNQYKLQFRQQAFAEFFQAHSEEEWFLEKYHPILKQNKEKRRAEGIQKRLDVFMQLLVRGWIEVSLDMEGSRKVRKLIDAAIVLMEGGDEGDIACLSDLDYVLEEKREETYDIVQNKMELSDSEDDEDEKGKTVGRMLTNEEREEQNEKGAPNEEELEIAQHAGDYSYYIQERVKCEADLTEEMEEMAPEGSLVKKAEYVGSGVFVQQVVNPKTLEEMNLHKTAALMLRNVPPTVPYMELHGLFADLHGGFLRLSVAPPDSGNRYFRTAIASFWHNANLQKIIWKIRGMKLKGIPLVIIEYREFKRKILEIDGLAGDKSVVLRDIQLCKSLIEYLDKRYHLWGNKPADQKTDVDELAPKCNPLLVNLDECLAFHLRQLIESGHDPSEVPKAKPKVGKVDRDENLTRVLDRLIIYLRIVHSIDYYGCRLHEIEDDQPRRIGPIHIRGDASRKASPKSLASYIKKFEEKLKGLLPQDKKLADEHVELLGKRKADEECERFIQNNVISIRDGMAKCCLCYKRFQNLDFATAHIRDKHPDKLEEVKWVVVCFNNYLADPCRPCDADFSAATPTGPMNSDGANKNNAETSSIDF